MLEIKFIFEKGQELNLEEGRKYTIEGLIGEEIFENKDVRIVDNHDGFSLMIGGKSNKRVFITEIYPGKE